MMDGRSNALLNGDNMTEKDNRMHLAAHIKGMAGFLACWLTAFSPGLVLGQTGPVLPPQATQPISELTTLVVTNTAVETNIPPGRQFSTLLITNRQNFAYADRNALLADGWSFYATSPGGAPRNTEITNAANGALVSYDQVGHPGVLRIPCDVGDLWGTGLGVNNTRNSIFRSLAANWVRVRLAITFQPTFNYQQMHLALYQDDDNYVQVGYAYNGGTNSLGGTAATLIWEYGGYPQHEWATIASVNMIEVRMDRDPNTGNVTGYFSLDGVGWTALGPGVSQALVNPRLGIWVGGSPSQVAGVANCDLRELEVVTALPTVSFSYSLLNPPVGATISTDGVITWTPTEAQGPGTNVLTTVVTDNGIPPLSTTNSFTVVVAEVNTPPTLLAQPDRMISLPNSLAVTNRATDTDIPINPLSYQLTVAPAGATIDTNGVINWSPSADQQMTNLFVTVVTDSNPRAINAQHLSATNSFTVVVLPPPWPVLPNQAARSVDELTAMVVTNTATDGSPTVSQVGTNTILFNYTDRAALLADGWTFIGTTGGGTDRNTEYTAGQGGIDYNQFAHLGVLNIPCDQGDLLGTAYNNTRNSLFRPLPSGWQSVSLALTFAPVTGNYQQAHLGLYQDDDNYVQMGVAYNSYVGNECFTMDGEIGGFATTPARVPTVNTTLYFRLDRNPVNSTVTNSYSFDGAHWTVLGVMSLTLTNPRLMIWTGGSQATYANGMAVMGLSRLDIVAPITVPTDLSYTLINPPAGATIDGNGIISWQPSETDGPGSVVFTTVVTDNSSPPLRATNSFNVVVNEINTPPTLLSQADRVLVGLQTLTVTNVATDTDFPTNTLNFSLNQAPAGAVINAQGVITWTPSTAQVPSTNVFVTVVTDYNPWAVNAQHLSATNSFTVVVNAIHNGPTLPARSNMTIAELTPLVLANPATDTDLPVPGLSYSLISPPAGLTINANGVINWTPSEAQGPSTNTITTVVTDNGVPSLSATNSFVVVVNEINTPPVLPVQPDRTLAGQQALLVANTASDSDIPTNSLTYQLSTAPAGAAIDTNGVITWTPSSGEVPSTNVFTIIVTDYNPWALTAQHLSATNTFTVVVNPGAIHNGPTLPVQTNLTIAELTTLTVTNTAIDTDVPALGLTYSLVGPPAGLTIGTNAVITWTPSKAQGPGTNTITTVVTDAGVPPVSATNSFTVVVNEINTPPVLPVQSNRTLAGTQTLTVTNTATDSDIPVNSLSYAFQAAPAGASLDTNGIITWTPALAQVPSTNVFTTVVTDYNSWAVNNQHMKTTNSFTVVVNAVHNGPVLAARNDVTVAELTTLRITNTASDSDIPVLSLTYSLSGAPTGATISASGVITWTPSEAQGPSTNTITTIVRDNGTPALSATNSFSVVVNEINVAPVLPVQTNCVLVGQQAMTVTNTATDSDIPANTLTYQLVAPPAGASIDANGVINWTPSSGQAPSTNIFTTVVTDYNPWAVNSQHLSATNSFTVTLIESRKSPTIQSITMNNGQVVISWDSAVGSTYRLQYKLNFGQANWTDLLPDVTAAGCAMTTTNAIGSSPARFFRVLLLP
jgi:hypothetical protein